MDGMGLGVVEFSRFDKRPGECPHRPALVRLHAPSPVLLLREDVDRRGWRGKGGETAERMDGDGWDGMDGVEVL